MVQLAVNEKKLLAQKVGSQYVINKVDLKGVKTCGQPGRLPKEKMKKFILLIFLVFTFSLSAAAQIFENGKIADLKNLKKVFIASDVSSLEYKQIRAELKRVKIPGLQIVDSAEMADFSLIFVNEKSEPDKEKHSTAIGMGMVAMNSPDGTKIRILMEYASKFGERNTAVKFARKVIAKYKEVNGLK